MIKQTMSTIQRIGVLTSGGDSPGMNAAVRAVTRSAIYHNKKVCGILQGYEGMIQGFFRELQSKDVANIIQRGGTILKSSRSEAFKTKEGMQKAFENLLANNIDALVVIGGDGTFAGALEFGNTYNFPIVGLPGTIDNDLYGTDFTIGYDTAINTVVSAVDKIKDTADSHNRLFFIEVMGRDAGFIALRSGIAVGAEDILIPEEKTSIEELIHILEHDWHKQKTSGIIIVAEGDDAGGAFEVARRVREKFNYYSTRVTILGHIQRGGAPTCMDRVLASNLGFQAAQALIQGKRGVMVGTVDKKIRHTPFEQSIKHHQDINRELLEMARILSL